MKCLITGAYGFVGSNLCRYLVAHGHQCDALDVAIAIRDDVPYQQTFTWDDLDTLKPQLNNYTAIIHLAGKAHDLKKVCSPQSYFDINVGLTKKIFEFTHDKIGKFIYFSSSKAIEADTPYGQSKKEAEEYLNDNAIILRPAMIHGPGNKGNLNLLWKIAQLGLPWPLAAFENLRSFASIENVCAAVEQLAIKGENGIYSIADDTPISTNRIIELMAQTQGRKAKLWRIPKGMMRFGAKIGDVLHLPLNTERLQKLTEDSLLDNTALKQALGWKKMPIQAEAGLISTLNAFKESSTR
jgi:nucleoside-diphosphate-sugar epimerase